MHALRQDEHDNHTRLRRVLAQKLHSREAVLGSRSPQFGHGFGGFPGGGGSGRGNGNGNGEGGGRGDRDGPGRGHGGFGGFGGFGGGNSGNGGPGRGNGNGGGSGVGSGNGGGDGPGSGNGGGNGPGSGNGSNNGGGSPGPQPSPTNPPVNNPPAPSPTSPSPPTNTSSPPSRGDDANVGSGSSAPGSGGVDEETKPGSGTSTTTGDNTKGVSAAPGESGTTATGPNTATVPSPQDSATALGSAPNTDTFEGVPPATETGTGSPLITGATGQSGLPSGTIAGIVVVCLLLLLLLLAFLVRRRWVSRRRDRMQRWWFTRKRTSQSFEEKTSHPVYNEKSLPAIPTMEASSVDLRSASPFDSANIVPAAPPMAEVRGHHGQTGHYTQADSDQMSLNSVNLGTAESECSQYIILRNPLRRPSESESFKFPKPPSSVPSEAPSIHSRSGSSHSGLSKASLAAACAGSTASLPGPSALSRPPLTAPPPPLKMDVIPNPFIDPGLASASTMGNPFETSEEGHALATVGNFAEVETIRRPYTPTLSDELQVSVGERVKVLEIFNDGWALVEKITQGGNQVEKGLVPIACLREANEALSTFLHTKTVQSFHVAKQTVD